MPQNNIFLPAKSPTNVQVPLLTDTTGALLTGGALHSTLNITAATVVKAVPGKLVKYSVVVGGSTAGSINDCATTGAAASTNQIVAIPTTVTVSPAACDWPCSVGIVVVPGTGSTIAVTYD